MFSRKTLKVAATGAIALSMLAAATAQALWVQNKVETEIITQFHGDPENADLVLFMAGNQFVVMDNLIAEFKKQNPKIQEIHYVTIPPGQELQWILQEGAEWRAAGFPNVQELVKPNPNDPTTWTMSTTTAPGAGFKMTKLADVYTTVARGHMNQLAAAGLVDEMFTYTHNQLALMAHTTQEASLLAIAEDDTIIADTVDDGKPGVNVDGELTAEGLYRVLASGVVTLSEPDIKTQGIERHIWRMYTNASHAVYGCPASAHAVCSVAVNDVRPPQPDDFAGMTAFFAGESDLSLRKIVYYLKRFNLAPYNATTATTFVTTVHHLETPANIADGLTIPRLTTGPVWGTEVEFQQFRRSNPDIIAIRIDDGAGPDGKSLNRSDDVNYLAAEVDEIKNDDDDDDNGNDVKADNHKAAKAFLDFLKTDEAQVILERAGFIPATQTELNTPIPLP